MTVANPRVPEQVAAFHAALPGAHGLIGSSVAIDAALLARAPKLDAVLARADIIAVTLPLSAQTRGLLGAREFGLMKPGAIFVNGACGAIVQEDTLLAALDAGSLRAAGLDVFATEPLPGASPLRRHPKVTALPHIGSATHETRHAMAAMATSNLLQALAGEPPLAVYAPANS